MQRRGLLGVMATAACLGTVPGVADAATFCVQKPKCVNAGGTSVSNLGNAITSAAANGGSRDRIELGAKDFDDGPWTAGAGNPVNIVGMGEGKTTLRRLGTSIPATILSLGDSASRASGFRLVINEGNGATGILTAGRLDRVRVSAPTAAFGQIGVLLTSGGLLSRGNVSMPLANSSVAVGISGDSAKARNSTLRADIGLTGGGFEEPAIGTRLRIKAQTAGVATSSNLILDQGTIRLVADTGGEGLRASSSSGTQTVVARHLTIVGSGGDDSVGVISNALGVAPSNCPVTNLVLRNSIVRGFDTDLMRSATTISCSTAVARLNLAWNVFRPLSVAESGDGVITTGKGNLNANPRFVKPANGNYRLKASSPLIDRGQPGKPGQGESKVDLDGRNRVLDGDGKAGKRRDIGAFERKAASG